MNASQITKGMQVKVTHSHNGRTETAVVDSVILRDFPAVYVTYADGTNDRVCNTDTIELVA